MSTAEASEPRIRTLEVTKDAIVAELTEAGNISSERIKVKPPAADDKKDSVSAALSLEAGK